MSVLGLAVSAVKHLTSADFATSVEHIPKDTPKLRIRMHAACHCVSCNSLTHILMHLVITVVTA